MKPPASETRTPRSVDETAAADRAARLKAALQANIARRKAQSRARSAGRAAPSPQDREEARDD
jgi:hypothetical protein